MSKNFLNFFVGYDRIFFVISIIFQTIWEYNYMALVYIVWRCTQVVEGSALEM